MNDLNKEHQIKELFEKGLSFYNKREYEEATNFFEKVLAIEPNHLDNLIRISSSYIETKKYQKSLSTLNKLLELKPNQKTLRVIWNWIGLSHEGVQNFPEAIKGNITC